MAKTYKTFMNGLPSRAVVYTFESFAPPTIYHDRLIRFAQKLAEQNRANCMVFTPSHDGGYIDYHRKMHYLNMLYPNVSFNRAESLQEAIDYVSSNFKRHLLVCETAQNKLVENYVPIDVPLHDAVFKARQLAAKGALEEFTKIMPSNMRSIDSRQLMNDMRESMDLNRINQQIDLPKDTIREQYFRGEIFNVGDTVQCVKTGQLLKIGQRGTNNLICRSEDGSVFNKWLHEVAIPNVQ